MSLSILRELRALGVEVIPQGGNLIIRPASKVPPELKERLRACKAEVLAVLAPLPAQPGECRHCDSTGKCSCPACTLRRTEKAVPCLMCHPLERQVWLAATRPRECFFCEERRLHGESGPCENCAKSGRGAVWTQ